MHTTNNVKHLLILLHHAHVDQFIIPSSRQVGLWIFRLVKGVNLKTKGSNSDNSV